MDGSEVGGCIEDDGLHDLDHICLPLLLVWLAYEYVYVNINVHICNIGTGWQRYIRTFELYLLKITQHS